MTTKEAFEKLISKRAWYKEIDLSESAASTLVSRFRKGENVSTDKIEEILEKAGFSVVQEKLWSNE